MTSTQHDYSRIETLTWTLAVAIRRKLGADYRIKRVAWSGGQGQGLDLTAGNDQPLYRLCFLGWGGNHLEVEGQERGHPLDAKWVWQDLAAGRVSVERLARQAVAAARPFRRPVRQANKTADAYATAAYEFVAAAMRASLVNGLRWEVDTAVPLDDGMGSDAYPVDLATSTWALPYLALFDKSQFDSEHPPRTSDDVTDWHFIHSPDGPVCAVDPAKGVYLPNVGRVDFVESQRGPAWQSVLRLLDVKLNQGSLQLLAPGTGATVALASQAQVTTLEEYWLGSVRLVDLELHGPALTLRPKLRARIGTAAHVVIPPHAWVGRRVTAAQVTSAMCHSVRNSPSEELAAVDVKADLLVAWSAGSAKQPLLVVLALFVASSDAVLAQIPTFVKVVESEGPVDLRVVVLDPLGLVGSDEPSVVRPADLF